MPEIAHRSKRNRILRALPAGELERMERELSLIDMPHGTVLIWPDAPIESVYFPLTGACSIIADTPEGESADVAIVGNEGFVGLPVYLGTGRMPVKAVGQVPGHALRMESEAFTAELARGEKLVDLLRRYTQMRMVEMGQTILCNRVHPVRERTARWLLQLNERVDEAPFELTQELFAAMLGARRASVTESAVVLREAGLIDYSRGVIDILDAVGLEKAACSCYRIIRNELDRLLESPA